jgi:hypothetical protein
MPPSVQNQSISAKDAVWESAISTEFKHAGITLKGAVATRKSEATYVCAMGAIALDTSVPGTTYRCRVRVIKMTNIICLGVASQNILRANNFVPMDG